MRSVRIAVIGAGIAGLAAAVDLARGGMEVQVFERAAVPGGKLRQVRIDGIDIDAGPTVFTLRHVFDALFADAGDSLEHRVNMVPAALLARHAWHYSDPLDLFADVERSVDAIGHFAGRHDADGFREFTNCARRIYRTLDQSFMRSPRPSVLGLTRRVGLRRGAGLWHIQPFTTLWKSVGRYFRDPRLHQLFARYATYCGSSPFDSPATLMLVAHAEQSGVWYIEGGMQQLALQLAELAQRRGAVMRYGSEIVNIHVEHGRVCAVQTHRGERIPVDAVVCNADTNALASGMFGESARHGAKATPPSARSLSAFTWSLLAQTQGFELAHHSVFFSNDYRAEFDDIFRKGRTPQNPTIYVCAQDRIDGLRAQLGLREKLFCLINAPATGDRHTFQAAEIDACETLVFKTLAEFGLTIQRERGRTRAMSPSDFNQLFPGTGGALYGPASHGWMASFRRPGSRSAIPGLYLAGGSSHPGPGLPMAATSGRLAAASVVQDRASILRSHTVAMPGGTSMG
jgi:1-hydroxycarotenoid 3,4-desaturase